MHQNLKKVFSRYFVISFSQIHKATTQFLFVKCSQLNGSLKNKTIIFRSVLVAESRLAGCSRCMIVTFQAVGDNFAKQSANRVYEADASIVVWIVFCPFLMQG